jgi:hypothetical protein
VGVPVKRLPPKPSAKVENTQDRANSLSGVVLLAMYLCACDAGMMKPPKAVETDWKAVGSWSGHGDLQTESFTSDTGGFRVRWETRRESPPGAGRLRVVFHSGDSGREIMEAVDTRGNGSGTAEVGDRPRWYFLTIESANLEWVVTVEEPVSRE